MHTSLKFDSVSVSGILSSWNQLQTKTSQTASTLLVAYGLRSESVLTVLSLFALNLHQHSQICPRSLQNHTDRCSPYFCPTSISFCFWAVQRFPQRYHTQRGRKSTSNVVGQPNLFKSDDRRNILLRNPLRSTAPPAGSCFLRWSVSQMRWFRHMCAESATKCQHTASWPGGSSSKPGYKRFDCYGQRVPLTKQKKRHKKPT